MTWTEWQALAEDESRWTDRQEKGLLKTEYKDKERFQLVRGEYASIWPNPETGAYDEQAIDLAPECARFFCKRYGTQVKGSPGEQVA